MMQTLWNIARRPHHHPYLLVCFVGFTPFLYGDGNLTFACLYAALMFLFAAFLIHLNK